ncbi:DUF58 domain-containing protein [Streptomyces sp. HUCO-GS316]|uniref:DUF58 domain-containing protein n=1 Tax=Streptomyces sp. HUCO-GS316 TaxID=2692198 RepID=UPI00136F19ED|nr:DUF58 domain-containing protein [Streptomyces sp. HUCO-GS316]MXM67430.1 DUF58 domain-containing protein [Streptomyces sp. HUCO-GS316]
MITRTGLCALAVCALLTVLSVVFASPALAVPAVAGLLALGAACAVTRPTTGTRAALQVATPSLPRGRNVRVEIRADGRLPRCAHLRLCHRGPHEAPVSLPLPGPSDASPLRLSVPAPRRGLLRIGPVVLRQEDPLGLFRRDTELAPAHRVEVHPAVTALSLRDLARGPADSGGGHRAAPSLDADFFTLRAYDPGDDPRHIHWLSSARSGQLLVRRSAEPVVTRFPVALDLDASAYAGPALFEEAVDLTASLLVAAVRNGAAARLWTLPPGDTGPGCTEFTGVAQVLTELTRVQARSGADGGPGERDTAGRGRRAPHRVPSDQAPLTVVTGGARPEGPSLPGQLPGRRSRVVVLRLAPADSGPSYERPAAVGAGSGRATVRTAADALHGLALWSAAIRRTGPGGGR